MNEKKRRTRITDPEAPRDRLAEAKRLSEIASESLRKSKGDGKMPPPEENGTDKELDEAFKVFEKKMSLEERQIVTHQQVLYLRRDMCRLEKAVQFKDTCEANHKTDNQRMQHIEGDVKELKEANDTRNATILAVVAIIVAVVVPLAAMFIH